VEAPRAPPVTSVVEPPPVAPVPSASAVEPSPDEPALAVELRDGVAQVRGQGFEPGERITVSLDEHDDEKGFGHCKGVGLSVTANARGVFRARLHPPACAALLCADARQGLGATAEWACGSDCRRLVVVPACPGKPP